MRDRKYILIKLLLANILLVLSVIVAKAQSGPGGVGNSDGSNGQPRNVLWLSADALSLSDTDPVSTWIDLSGNGNDASQTSASARPLFRTGMVNGMPAVVFDGVDDFMPFNGNLIVNTDFTVIYVAARRNNGANFVLAGTTESCNQNMHFGWRNSTQNTCNHWCNDVYSTLSGDGSTYVGDGDASDDYGIFTNRLASTETAPQRRVFQNGQQIGSINNANQLSAYGGSAIARWRATPRYYEVNVAEVIFFTKPLNDAQLQIVHEYLNQKYGVTLPNDLYSPDASYVSGLIGIGEEANGQHSEAAADGFYLTALSGVNVGDYVFASHNNLTNNSASFRTDAEITASGAQEAYNRIWYVGTVGTPSAQIAFDFSEALEDGLNPTNIANYVLLYRSGTSGNFTKVKNADGVKNGDQLYFNLTEAQLQSGYYTLGTEDATNTPLEGVAARTWYTLVSGDWDTWDTWTLDPSGALPNNPDHYTPTTSPTAVSDEVVVLTGRTVTVTSDNLNNASITVDGRLDLGTTTGHSFGEIRGTGRILMATDNFPSGDASHFVSKGQGEGIVEFYGGTYSIANSREFYDVEVELDNSSNTLTLLNDLTVNGNLTVITGNFQLNDATDDRKITVSVGGDLSVKASGAISVGTGNPFASAGYQIGTGYMPQDDGIAYHDIYHQLLISGNFTNRGTVRFTNLDAPDYNSLATNGAVTVRFTGAENCTVNLYGTTDFYNLVIDKGTDKTFRVNLYSDNTTYFRLFGANSVGRLQNAPFSAEDPQVRKALFIHHGTLQLRGNIYIPTLSEGNQEGGNGDYAVGKNARLWIDGSNVKVYSTASNVDQITGFTSADTYTADGVRTSSSNQAMSVFGEFRITSGTFGTRNSAGFIFWAAANAQLKIEGGSIDVSQMRSAGASGIASYIQSGGTVTVRGNETEPGEYTGAYPLFGLQTPDAVFQMSGGTIILRDEDGDADPEWYIPCSEGNYSVTGGSVRINVRDTRSFQLFSTANFWNLEISNSTGSGSMLVQLDTNLVVANNLTLNPYVELDVEDPTVTGLYHDVTIGGNFSIYENAVYTYGQNTTTFNGDRDGELYIGHNTDDGYEQYFWNITVDKSAGKRITIKGDTNKDPDNVGAEWHNRLVHVVNDIKVVSGIFDQGRQSARLFGGVYVYRNGQLGTYTDGTTPRTAYVMFRDGDLTINSEDGATFGNIKFNSTGTVTFTSDVYIKRIGFYRGMYNLQTFNLKVDYLEDRATSNRLDVSDADASQMIYCDGNASDGGISQLITQNGTYAFPFGNSGKYTPAEVVVTNFADSGYIQIRPVDGELKTTNLSGGDLLSYYWRVGFENFSTNPTVSYTFYYDDADDDNGSEALFYPGKVLDIDPFTRSYENDLTKVDESNNTISFTGSGSGFTLEKANYTAGVANRFTGTVRVYYSCKWNGWTGNRWSDPSVWSTVSHESTVNSGTYPQAGDIARIGYDTKGTNSGSGGDYHSILCDINNIEVAALIFDGDGTTWNPRLYVQETQTHTFNMVSGRGGFVERVSPTAIPTVNADFGDFTANNDAVFYYHCRADGVTTLPAITRYPNLRIEGNTSAGVGNRILVFPVDMLVNGNMTIDGGATIRTDTDADGDITVNGDLYIGGYRDGAFEFSSSGTPRTLTVKGDITIRNGQAQSPNNKLVVLNTSPNNLIHRIKLYGNLVQREGNIDLFTDNTGGNNVVLELLGSDSKSYSSLVANIPDLYRIEMNKGSSQTPTFTISNNINLGGPTNGAGVHKALELISGTFQLDNPAISLTLNSGDDDFKIPAAACLRITQGTVTIEGDNTGIWLDGKLLVDGGTVDMVSGTGNGNNYIEYSSSGNAAIEISAGNLWVGSQIRRGTITEEGVLAFKQSGGTLLLGVNAGGDNDRAIFEVLNTGSSFTHTGGDFILVNDRRSAPSVASFYFDPQYSSLSAASTIQLGNASTLSAYADFTLYAADPLRNLTISSTGSPSLTLSVVPLTLSGNLTINSNATFDANGLDITIKGDWTNNGTFTHNRNSTYFSGTANQQLTGETTFWNLHKTTANTLTLSSDVDVDNELHLDSGTFDDGDNTLSVQGYVWLNATHTWGGNSDGILLNGTAQQVLTGSGTFGKLSINNSSGVFIPQGNTITIDGALQLEHGVLDIGKNLLILDTNASIIEKNPFSETNMIQTNISFTDAGVKKFFPAVVPADGYSFVYPIGSEGKYTPVELDIDRIDAGGSIRVKGANERHPTIVNDTEPCKEIEDTANVLKYHWLLEASGVTGFTANARMHFHPDDYQENSAFYDVTHYIAARLLLGSTLWNKFDPASFDEGNNLLRFSFSNTNDDGISGDYTAGIEDQAGTCKGAIPDEVPTYITIRDGNWTDETIWDTYPTSGGTVPAGGPRGAIAIVAHTVTIPSNYILSYKTIIRPTGLLKVGTTYGHRLGIVEGTGTLQLERGSLPAGVYDDFFGRSGGTIEFSGSDDYDVLSEVSNVRNLKFSGTGERRLPNLDVEVYGLLSIAGTDATLKVINEHDRNMTLDSNLVFTAGSFDAGVGTSTVFFTGSSQQVITGDFTGSNAFNNFEIDNANGITLAGNVEIDGTLRFTDGIITSDASHMLTVDNASSTAVTGYGDTRYVDGPMQKRITSGESFLFPVGDDGRYGRIQLSSTATSSQALWEAQYYNANPHPTMDTSARATGLEMVSGNEYWRVKRAVTDSAKVMIRWDDQSMLPGMTSNRSANLKLVEWTGTRWQHLDGTVADGGVNSGTIISRWRVVLDEHYFTIGSTEPAPVPTAGFISPDTSICAGTSASLRVRLTGKAPWSIKVDSAGTVRTHSGIASSPYTISTDPVATTTYTITEVTDATPLTSTSIFGNPVTVTVIPNPTIFNVTGGGEYCSGGTGVSVGLDGSETGVSYELLVGAVSLGIWSGTGSAIDFGNQTMAGTYTVIARDGSGTCSRSMNGSATVVENPIPQATLTVNAALDSICDGSNTRISITFTGTPPFNLTITDGTNSENLTGVTDNPFTYIPATAPVWVNDGTPDTDYYYSVTTLSDAKCSNSSAQGNEKVTVFKVPETGNVYHIKSDWSN